VIETDHDLKSGDRLQLGLSESALVKASLTIYGLPLLGMVCAGLLATLVTSSDALVAGIAFAGFYAGFKMANYVTRALEVEKFAPYIIDIHVNPGPHTRS
jgi:positive regulator of sigma E activity